MQPKPSKYYIRRKASFPDGQVLILKQNDTFAVFDAFGDIQPAGIGQQGLYHQGTRFLSKCILHLGAHRPLLLSSSVHRDNVLLAVDLSNPDVFSKSGELLLPHGALHLYRTKFLWNGVCYERLRIHNYGLTPIEAVFSIRFDADFADVFEVRGQMRKKTGLRTGPIVENGGVAFEYCGLDNVKRRLRFHAAPSPLRVTRSEMFFKAALQGGQEAVFSLTASCEVSEGPPALVSYEEALANAASLSRSEDMGECVIYSSNEQFNDWVNRSAADLRMMVSELPTGPYPYAGVPWFSAPFGRDGIITALQYLWLEPRLARGVLAYLAETQAKDVNPEQDAEPGKILHEARGGEMAALGEVPFRRYYGSVDSTPLFVLLAAEYFQHTADAAFLESIWRNIEEALAWIDGCGDRDGDGFVEYFRQSPQGLVQQGWKDSHDSVFHSDGRLAQGPIALCEVQAYVYAAKNRIAQAAMALGHTGRAAELQRQARQLQERFERAFWCEELSTYGLALDGEKKLCRVRTSNAGHCLFAGIASPERAVRTAETLLALDSFSGWGIRTVSSSEIRYNPMSYHNGSVWPHDNALIACGMGRYDLKQHAARVLTGLFDSSIFVDLHRLPELYCGFERRAGKAPTLYPVACAPQAWASAAVFMLLRACLGLTVDARVPRLVFTRPFLPPSLRRISIRNLRVGPASLDLSIERYAEVVGIDILRRDSPVEVLTIN
ncbi:MAG TPA: amylo-alpha-1,6-glucosidase [Bryobacteraceae bacterium]|nr:amylo-alpha-1,6-glucosidase [Bryobacteraceae bacterium]